MRNSLNLSDHKILNIETPFTLFSLPTICKPWNYSFTAFKKVILENIHKRFCYKLKNGFSSFEGNAIELIFHNNAFTRSQCFSSCTPQEIRKKNLMVQRTWPHS